MQNWYKRTEAVLFEQRTIDAALEKLEKRTDSFSKHLYEEKLRQRNELKETLSMLTPYQQRFVRDYYRLGVCPIAMCTAYALSESTFYRRKKDYVKLIAKYMGYV